MDEAFAGWAKFDGCAPTLEHTRAAFDATGMILTFFRNHPRVR